MNADPYAQIPDGFLRREDEDDDREFYGPPRLLLHIDDAAIDFVGRVYERVGVGGRVLDLCASWVSHLKTKPDHLTVLGMNAIELDANEAADERVVHDLNADPRLPLADASFEHVVCTVSVDYLVRPVEVFQEVARVLVAGGTFCCTFSNRCFPTKAVYGWLATPEDQRPGIVASYFRLAGGWGEPRAARVTPADHPGDPVWACWARSA
ncbi:MAG: class I SAM-dependent methyltransferase [Acidimicrobiia bacterium]